MKYRVIPHTDLQPSVLCLGAASFGSDLDPAIAFQLLDTFFAHGGNFIDTARVYGAWIPNGLGLSEKTVGQWLKERGVREQIILATKGAHPDFARMDIPRLSRQDILADLHESLRSLQTETIDLYWLHRDDPQQPVAALLETLNEQVTRGNIRYFGCSNWRVERIAEAADYAAAHGLAAFVGDQCMWSYAVPNQAALEDKTLVTMDASLYAYHLKTNLAAVAYTSQARGFFAKANANPPTLSEHLRTLYSNDENIRRLQRLQKLSQALSESVAVLSLAYLTSQPFPTFPISAYTSVAQLLESIKAGDIELPAETVRSLATGE